MLECRSIPLLAYDSSVKFQDQHFILYISDALSLLLEFDQLLWTYDRHLVSMTNINKNVRKSVGQRSKINV